MKFFLPAEVKSCGGVQRRRCLPSLFGGGVLLLAASAVGCQETLSSLSETLGQPIATGISSGLSNLVEALVLSLFL